MNEQPTTTKKIQDDEAAEIIRRHVIARKAITDKEGNGTPPVPVSGNIQCPVCEEGSLCYGISSYNGMIRAACTTRGCVNWIE